MAYYTNLIITIDYYWSDIDRIPLLATLLVVVWNVRVLKFL